VREVPLAVVVFFVSHWVLAAFFQVVFLHRYASHAQFSMSKRWERAFYLMTYFAIGASFLPPRAYALMHRAHHAYSDTSRDPHSPRNHRSALGMAMEMRRTFDGLAKGEIAPEPRFAMPSPQWAAIDRLGWWAPGQVAWVCGYLLFYVHFASPWAWPLVAVHAFIAPIQGALVNWCGHRYGYRNFDDGDRSTNALPIDVLVLGDMMQNNHHHRPQRVSNAVRWFEVDLAGLAIGALAALHVVRLRGADR
jgi:stearoyl-CoA desaturase (delta-9 desaturase)